MLETPHSRAQSDAGFSLVELLVVILIIGILAAIAIPAFLNQRSKAYDAAAKANLITAAKAEETYATDHGDRYTAADTSAGGDPLVAIEPTLSNRPTVTASLITGGYRLVSTAVGPSNQDVYTYTDTNGAVNRTCTGTGGGCVGGTW